MKNIILILAISPYVIASDKIYLYEKPTINKDTIFIQSESGNHTINQDTLNKSYESSCYYKNKDDQNKFLSQEDLSVNALKNMLTLELNWDNSRLLKSMKEKLKNSTLRLIC